jgi:hypothetical protein
LSALGIKETCSWLDFEGNKKGVEPDIEAWQKH